MVAVVEGASTIQLTFRRSTVTAHDAPRPEAVTTPEELRLAAPESHRPLKNLVRGKRSLPLLGYVNPGGARYAPLCTRACRQFHTLRVRLPHNAPPPRPSSRNGTHRAERRPSRGGVKTLFRVPLRYLRSAACDPRFCARRGPTALPFPPTTPQAPKNPCSPPSAVLWPNLTSRSSSVYGLVPFLCGPSTTEGQDLPGPCFGACPGSRTPRSPRSPHQRGSLPSATTSALRFQSISWLNSLPLPNASPGDAWFTEKLASLGTCTRPHSTSLPGAPNVSFTNNAGEQKVKVSGCFRSTQKHGAGAQATSPPWRHSATTHSSQPRSPSTEKPQTSSTSTTTNQNPTRGE